MNPVSPRRTALVLGAGPAGLTAAAELLVRTDYRPVVVEPLSRVGGLARTEVHAGNRIDIGGHRFFTRSARVEAWWLARLPAEGAGGPDPTRTDRVMLRRSRVSRILFAGRLFRYPIQADAETVRLLGPARVRRILVSYLRARLRPRPEVSLEDFFVNRFGRELYATFFKDYTEKVWGVACDQLPAEWGAQRVKGLSIGRAMLHAARARLGTGPPVARETSLIESFLYPKLGPGQLWEAVADEVVAAGGEVRLGQRAERLVLRGGNVVAVWVRDLATGALVELPAPDLVISTMPLQDLVAACEGDVPAGAREVAAGLRYRDFLTVGLLLPRAAPAARLEPIGAMPDNWIYIQEPGVKAGRMQLFHNWSPYLVADPGMAWVGMEYFCTEGDALWTRSDAELIRFAADELARVGVADAAAVRDGVVLRVPKAYPAYLGDYRRLPELRAFLDGVGNLRVVGRNGMHRYNNQDHSMLAAMIAVDLLAAGSDDREPIWAVNTEAEYHEGSRAR